MRGLHSAASGSSAIGLAIRAMFGTHLPLLLQAVLVLWSAPAIDSMPRALVVVLFIGAAGALCAAIHGLSDDSGKERRRLRHVR